MVDHDERIAEAEARLAEARQELESHYDTVRSQAAAWVSDWWDQTMRGQIEERPEVVTEQLGPDGVREVKERLSQLKSRAPTLASEHLEKNTWAVHRWSFDELEKYVFGRHGSLASQIHRGSYGGGAASPGRALEECLRTLAGELGKIIVEAGLDDWYTRDANTRLGVWERKGGEVRWVIHLRVSDSLNDAIERYADATGELETAVKKVVETKREKAQAAARSLWDEA